MKRLVILGSTGSIGTQALEVVSHFPDKLKIIALTANNNIELLNEQVEKFRPEAVAIADEKSASLLKKEHSCEVFSGKDAIVKVASLKDYDLLVNALVGLAGIRATLTAISNKKDIALANKETLVAAGHLVMKAVHDNNVSLIPIDSEHTALHQCLKGEKIESVKRLILTCSGGALREKSLEDIQHATKKDALSHKTWKMGEKITIDSATLMNKGFEVIEASWLFGIPAEKIEVVIHPESSIHSLVEFVDGSIIAQLSAPDMRMPIQYALSFPERWQNGFPKFDFSVPLTFEKPDLHRFPCLGYAFEALKKGGSLPAAMAAANDFMVEQFLQDKCSFGDIPKVIWAVMDSHELITNPSLEEIEAVIAASRNNAEVVLRSLNN